MRVQPRPVVAGVCPVLLAVGVGLLLPFPDEVRGGVAVLVLASGLAGGYVAGRFADGGWRTGAVHGGLAGLGGGITVALAFALSSAGIVPRASDGVFWELNYQVATHSLLGPLREAFKGLTVPVLSPIVGLSFVVQGVIAGGAAPATRDGRESLRVE